MKRNAITWVALMLAAVVALHAEREVDRTVPVAADAEVQIDIVSGSLQISGWDRNEVQIRGWIGDDVEELIVEGRGRRVSIELDTPNGRGYGRRDIDADLVIKVPVGTRIDAETVSAGIDVEGLTGYVELGTVSGGIEVSGNPDTVSAESVSGSVRVHGARSAIDAESVSGSVRLESSAERLEASSVSGSIEIKAGLVTRGDFESVSGTVEFEGNLASNAILDLSSHSGSVRVYLPANVSATFDLSTFSGNLESEFGGTAMRTSRYAPGKTMEFTAGSGSAEVTVESFSGNVSIRKQ
jgi:DUF4097 and DUF4098 domain-containing protein YvlB